MLISAFVFQFSFAQDKTVKGVVSDALGPLSGANIVVKGTQNGTTSNFDGAYSIKANQGDVLVFSYVSMKDKEVIVNGSTLNVVLEEDIAQLEGVVVTALGISREKKSLGYATQEVTGDEVNKTPSTNL